jgi:enamine deaminase RidA (YjgF/YER057c/UK114 family)
VLWLADIADFAAMNEAWDAWAPAGLTPVRATVENMLAALQYPGEIGGIGASG